MKLLITLVVAVSFLLIACGGKVKSATVTPTVTSVPTQTPIAVPSATPTYISEVGSGVVLEPGVFYPSETGQKIFGICADPKLVSEGVVLFETENSCLVQYPSSQRVALAVVRADNLVTYRSLKKELECAISKVRRDNQDQFVQLPVGGERLFWTPIGLTNLGRDDLASFPCDPGFVPPTQAK